MLTLNLYFPLFLGIEEVRSSFRKQSKFHHDFPTDTSPFYSGAFRRRDAGPARRHNERLQEVWRKHDPVRAFLAATPSRQGGGRRDQVKDMG